MNFKNTWNKMVGFFIIGKNERRKLNERLIETLEYAKSEFERLYDEIDSYHKPGFPYYRKVCNAAYTEPGEYQCLACKHIHYYQNYINFNDLKYCSKCGIEFVGEFTKKNKRHGYSSTFNHPFVNVIVQSYNRIEYLNKNSWNFYNYVPDESHYEWTTEYSKAILPFCEYMSAKEILKAARRVMNGCKQESKTIQLWAGPEGKEKLICEIQGNDIPRKPTFQNTPPSFFGGFYNPLNPQQLRNF